jgi:hypothetical protein
LAQLVPIDKFVDDIPNYIGSFWAHPFKAEQSAYCSR